MFAVCGKLSCAEVLADLEQPELGIEVPHLHYWSNNGEFTQVRMQLRVPPQPTSFLTCACQHAVFHLALQPASRCSGGLGMLTLQASFADATHGARAGLSFLCGSWLHS